MCGKLGLTDLSPPHLATMEGLPKHDSWTNCVKLFNKAASTTKSKAQVARAQHGKAEKAKKVMEAMLLKETKPQFINPGVTAADLRKHAKQADAHKHRAVSGLLLPGAIHVADQYPRPKACSEREMWDWMDKKRPTRQDAID